jgi:hypothetical protein
MTIALTSKCIGRATANIIAADGWFVIGIAPGAPVDLPGEFLGWKRGRRLKTITYKKQTGTVL